MTSSTAPTSGPATPARRLHVGVAGLGAGAVGRELQVPRCQRRAAASHPGGVVGLHDERMAELDEMYQALTTGRLVCHDGRWGTATLEIVLAIMQSAHEHRDYAVTPVRCVLAMHWCASAG